MRGIGTSVRCTVPAWCHLRGCEESGDVPFGGKGLSGRESTKLESTPLKFWE